MVPLDALRAGSDSELASAEATVVLTGGNIHLALGRPPARSAGDECMILPVDALQVSVTLRSGDDLGVIAASEVTVGSWFSRHGMTVITNGGLLGPLNIAPRAHPNDGRLDVFVLLPGMRGRDRATARRRARTGTHLPHPGLRVTTCTEITLHRAGRQRLIVDGVQVPGWARASVSVLPDRLAVAV